MPKENLIMSKLKTMVAGILCVSCMSALAHSLPDKIVIINNKKPVMAINVPAGAKIDVEADRQKNNMSDTVMNFEGKAKVTMTLSTGESINIQANEVNILSGDAGKKLSDTYMK
jgi:NAD(P)H-hydrate repair Nnr-like enzyme with NAD(P)H-hydrate epimerase domain